MRLKVLGRAHRQARITQEAGDVIDMALVAGLDHDF